MALIECNSCGHSVSEYASECPNCHHPLGVKGILTGVWGKIFLLSCALLLINRICNSVRAFILMAGCYTYDTSLGTPLLEMLDTLDSMALLWTILMQFYNIGLLGFVYVVGKSFKEKKTQTIVFCLIGAAFILREIVFVADLSFDIKILRILIYIMQTIAFGFMMGQIRQKYKWCFALLVVGTLCSSLRRLLLPLGLIGLSYIIMFVECVVGIVAYVSLLYHLYK